MAGKARVHELAKELGVTSKIVLERLKEQGEFVKSASSTVEAPVARRLRESFPKADESAPAGEPKKAPAGKSPAPAAPPDASDDPQTTPDPSVASEALTEATATGRDTFGHVRRPGDHRPRLWQKSEGERAMDMWDEAHRYGLAAIGVPAPGFQAKIISPVCDACGDDPDEWPCVNCHRGGDR